MKYNTIIVGASFAGLATASKISNGRTLLIDAKPIGTGIKSACGTVLETVLNLGLEDCVLQQHKKMVLHTARSNFTYHLAEPFCVIDEKKFCQRLFEQGQTEFIQTNVLDFKDNILKTAQGDFESDIFVDASGPNSVLTKNKSRYLSFGLETTVDYKEEGLHFWYEPKFFPNGVFWLFPQGDKTRIGIGSYVGEMDLLPKLEEFLKRFNLRKGSIHGGFFPHRLKEPVVNNIFAVGDSAGHCLPITGEGIRPAIVFGQKLGEIINQITNKNITRQEGLKSYADYIFSNRRKSRYDALYHGQKIFTAMPEKLFNFFAWLVSKKSIMSFAENKYLNILNN